MTNQELERRLAQAVEHAAPDDLEGVLSRCQERKGTVTIMKNNRNDQSNYKKNAPRRWLALAACMALLLVGGGGGYLYQQANAVASVVSLDVNPSVELNVNRNQKVLSCTGMNDDADVILKDMDGGADLEGTKLDVAVNALIGAMVRNGYLDDISSAILISVEDENTERAAQLRQNLTSTVDKALGEQSATASILSQTVESSAALSQQAKENSISTGKAALINRLMAMNNSLTFDGLASLSVEELHDLEEIGAPAMPIGKDAALKAAMTYAGITDSSKVYVDVDAELDDTPACYEVELGNMEYRVDAWDGKVIGTEQNDDHDDDVDDKPAAAQINETQAVETALSHAKVERNNLTGLSCELDADDGRTFWDIEFYANGYEYEYQVDSISGKILEADKDRENGLDRDDVDDDDDDNDDAQPQNAKPAAAQISKQQAVNAALKHAGLKQSQVRGLNTELDHGCWDVDFECGGYEYDYEIGAANGSVVKCEKERCDHDGAHHDDHNNHHDHDDHD